MTVEQAQASSIEVNKTPSRQRTAVASGSQISKFGIKAKLFLAFFSLAALTALASVYPNGGLSSGRSHGSAVIAA